jgi:membrane-bound lytic murein transglycosylase MltF
MTTRYDGLFQFYAKSTDWKLLKAQAIAESDLTPDAQSGAGAQGLCQFEPATFVEVATHLALKHPSVWNPEHSIQCQAAMMGDLIHRMGSVERALAAYNWGEGHVSRMPVWDETQLPAETQAYIKHIMSLKEIL